MRYFAVNSSQRFYGKLKYFNFFRFQCFEKNASVSKKDMQCISIDMHCISFFLHPKDAEGVQLQGARRRSRKVPSIA